MTRFTFLVLAALFCSAQAFFACHKPAKPANGHFGPVGHLYFPGAGVWFGCNPGYELHGTKDIQCVKRGWSLVWSAASPKCVRIQCPNIPRVSNGYIKGKWSNNFQGDGVWFFCNAGYKLEGVQDLVCNNGRWSANFPTCKAIYCPNVPTVYKGRIKGKNTGNRPGDKVWFSCNAGYSLVGMKDFTCNNNGQWSGKFPTCQVLGCPNVPMVVNGFIKGKNSDNRPGDKVWFFCNKGYTLEGTKDFVCKKDGKWSGTFPTCKRMQCPDVPRVVNRFIKGQHTGNIPGKGVWFFCNAGYTLIGKKDIRCTSNGQWSGDFPTCKAVTCAPLGTFLNGVVAPIRPTYPASSSIKYTCDHGYKLVGESRLTCLESGMFDGKKPSCQRIKCANPKMANGWIKGKATNNYPNDKVWFFCHKGYKIIGERKDLTCKSDGQWNYKFPTCRW